MVQAIWNGVVLAASDQCRQVEGNYYFPPESLNPEYFQASDTHTICSWKGEASYYTLIVNGRENPDAAWRYPNPKERAKEIQDYVAFWRGVQIQI